MTDHQQDCTQKDKGEDPQHQQKSMKTVMRLMMVVGGMFFFGFLMVPLYDVFCEVTGLNGKTKGQYTGEIAQTVDKSRWVTVQFLANNNDGMSWDFRPNTKTIKVHPGELTEVSFFASNPAGIKMTGKAVPSVTPFAASDYFHKTECFCFTEQHLDPGQEIDMPLRFIVDVDLPENISTLTLSYTLFDITQNVASNNK